MSWEWFFAGIAFGIGVFGWATYRLGQKAAEWVIGNKMW